MTALEFSELYRQHRPAALRIARRILRDPAEAEDVVQEVFARLSSNSRAAFTGRSAFSTWLHRIMVNSSINSLRSRRRRSGLSSTALDDTPPTPEEEACTREARERFHRALSKLGGRHEQVVWLRDVRGLSYPEISRLLGVPEGTVKSTLHRARARACELMNATHAPA